MTSAVLLDTKGKQVGEVNLEASVFGIEPNMDLMHTALHRQLANARSGSIVPDRRKICLQKVYNSA